MTKFETIGVNHQYDANSKDEANKAFMNSCKCCCQKGMRLECDRCAISHTHDLVVAYFNDRQVEQNKNKQQ